MPREVDPSVIDEAIRLHQECISTCELTEAWIMEDVGSASEYFRRYPVIARCFITLHKTGQISYTNNSCLSENRAFFEKLRGADLLEDALIEGIFQKDPNIILDCVLMPLYSSSVFSPQRKKFNGIIQDIQKNPRLVDRFKVALSAMFWGRVLRHETADQKIKGRLENFFFVWNLFAKEAGADFDHRASYALKLIQAFNPKTFFSLLHNNTLLLAIFDLCCNSIGLPLAKFFVEFWSARSTSLDEDYLTNLGVLKKLREDLLKLSMAERENILEHISEPRGLKYLFNEGVLTAENFIPDAFSFLRMLGFLEGLNAGFAVEPVLVTQYKKGWLTPIAEMLAFFQEAQRQNEHFKYALSFLHRCSIDLKPWELAEKKYLFSMLAELSDFLKEYLEENNTTIIALAHIHFLDMLAKALPASEFLLEVRKMVDDVKQNGAENFVVKMAEPIVTLTVAKVFCLPIWREIQRHPEQAQLIARYFCKLNEMLGDTFDETCLQDALKALPHAEHVLRVINIISMEMLGKGRKEVNAHAALKVGMTTDAVAVWEREKQAREKTAKRAMVLRLLKHPNPIDIQNVALAEFKPSGGGFAPRLRSYGDCLDYVDAHKLLMLVYARILLQPIPYSAGKGLASAAAAHTETLGRDPPPKLVELPPDVVVEILQRTPIGASLMSAGSEAAEIKAKELWGAPCPEIPTLSECVDEALLPKPQPEPQMPRLSQQEHEPLPIGTVIESAAAANAQPRRPRAMFVPDPDPDPNLAASPPPRLG